MRPISRRTALRLLAGTTVGATLPWLRSPSVRALEPGGPPLRILFIEAGHGCRRGTFEPEGVWQRFPQQDLVTTDWRFREKMSALAPYRERATMFNNLDMLSRRADPSRPRNAHIDGMTHMLTADSRHEGSNDTGAGPSIDQFIAQQLAKRVGTRLPSLELWVADDGRDVRKVRTGGAYSAPGQKVPFISHVPDAWSRVFPAAASGDAALVARREGQRQAAYALIRGDYDRLVKRLSGEDREKLMQMRDYHSDLQKTLGGSASGRGKQPDRKQLLGAFERLDAAPDASRPGNPNWRIIAQTMGKLAAAALHADVTRVVNLVLDLPPYYEYGYRAGRFGSSDAHDLDHKVSGDKPALPDPAAAAVIDEQHRVVYRQVRFILDELAGLKEPDGRSLLDHTLVVLYSHIAEGSHDVSRLPWVVFGDAHGQFKTGQYIQFAAIDKRQGRIAAPDADFYYVAHGIGRPHNDLFITLANAMGIEIGTFGNPSVATGPITHMLV